MKKLKGHHLAQAHQAEKYKTKFKFRSSASKSSLHCLFLDSMYICAPSIWQIIEGARKIYNTMPCLIELNTHTYKNVWDCSHPQSLLSWQTVAQSQRTACRMIAWRSYYERWVWVLQISPEALSVWRVDWVHFVPRNSPPWLSQMKTFQNKEPLF